MNHDKDSSEKTNTDAPDLVTLSAKHIEELERIALEAKIKDEIVAWGKSRFWWVTLALTVLGLLGGSALITTTITSLVDRKANELVAPLHEGATSLNVSYCSLFFGGGGLQGGQDRMKAGDFLNPAGALPLFVLSRSEKVVFGPVLNTPLELRGRRWAFLS